MVCIKTGKEVLDKAAIDFTKAFYKEIFEGQKVCEAFNQAKESVKFHNSEGESRIFQLLVKEQLEKQEK